MSIGFDKILFPTDFSDLALVALRHATELVDVFDAELHCLYVVDDACQYWSAMGPESIPVGPPPEDLMDLARTHMEQFQAEHLAELKKAPITHVAMGRPFAEIIAYARGNDINPGEAILPSRLRMARKEPWREALIRRRISWNPPSASLGTRNWYW